ncbi:hypothetical protein CDC58_21360, partial [Salmonella enterica]
MSLWKKISLGVLIFIVVLLASVAFLVGTTNLALKDINVAIDSKKMPPSEPAQEEEESGPLNLSTPWPITLSRVALNNINIKIDDTTVSVLDFTSGLAWQEKNL